MAAMKQPGRRLPLKNTEEEGEQEGEEEDNKTKDERSLSKMSDYTATERSTLKLKGLGTISAGKKKKKKDKESKHRLEQVVASQNDEEEGTKKAYVDKRTPAQVAFDKMQEKRQMERILNKASKTHKHRVEDFNRHLDNLTEHYDIPKVSWTK